MKSFIFVITLFLSSPALSDITVTWVPGEVVEGSPVDEWLLFCANINDSYPQPIIIPEVARDHTFLVPDGITKCMMRSRSNINIWGIDKYDSFNSIEITFLVSGGIRIDTRPNAPSLAVN